MILFVKNSMQSLISKSDSDCPNSSNNIFRGYGNFDVHKTNVPNLSALSNVSNILHVHGFFGDQG